MIEITASLSIPEEELSYVADRSSGPGGQHVNKVSTRVTLLFDVTSSPSLSDEQRARILEKLASRITKAGVLRVTSQMHRSQSGNKERALERFIELMREALHRRSPRKRTRTPRKATEKRLEEKTRRSETKKSRSYRVPVDD